MSKFKKNIFGFTLLELLITIGVLGILSAITVIVINPAEKLKESRDTVRIVDIGNIDNNLQAFLEENPAGSMGQANTVYVSLPSNQTNCSDLSLPGLSTGWTYACKPLADYRKIDGTGWIPVDLTKATGRSLTSLPIDPRNNSSYYYIYVTGGSWDLSSLLESEKKLKEVAIKDGGMDDGRYEIGGDLSLWTQASGLIRYWKFNENSGITAYDSSVVGNNGILTNGPTWVSGKVNNALSFDGVDDYVQIGAGNNYFPLPLFSVCAWIKSSGLASGMSSNGIISLTYGFIVELDGSGKFVTYIDSGSSLVYLSVPDNLYDNKFHHLCLTFNGSNRYMFVDGVMKNSLATTWLGTTRWSTNSCSIGHNNNPPVSKFNGLIDEARIYNRVLSVSEIQSLYNATK